MVPAEVPAWARARIWARRLAIAALATGGLGVLSLLSVFWWYGRGVAELDEARLRDYRPYQVTRVRARDGQLIGEIFKERRTLVHYDEIPTHVEQAFLAAEDADFYQHEGMDYVSMVRAFFVNLRAGAVRQGGSTITQQVVKVFMLSSERTFERKIQELILARRLERAFRKHEILELYLNEIYLGHGRYGIEEASRFYFGRSVTQIDLAQAALLATLPKAPGRDSPLRDPQRAKARQIYVLEQMVVHGFVDAARAQAAIDAPLPLRPDAPVTHGDAPEFVDAARAELLEAYSRDVLDRLGAEVHTTVDLDLQRVARTAVREGLRAVDHRNRFGRNLRPASKGRRTRLHASAPATVGGAQSLVAEIVADPAPAARREAFVARAGRHRFVVRVPADARQREEGKTLQQQFVAGALVRIRPASPPQGAEPIDGLLDAVLEPGPQACAVLADAQSGEILAMVGGDDYALGGYNRVLRARRQPGSIFKPIVYGAALASRSLTAASVIDDAPTNYRDWQPKNFEGEVYRGPIALRDALTHSVNTVAIKVLDQIGFDAVRQFATAVGIEESLPANLSLALGTQELRAIELLGAYQTLAAQGRRAPLHTIKRVVVDGQPQAQWSSSEATEAIDESVAFVLTSMLTSVVKRGTATGAKKLGRPAAGKTGTSADFRDAWFVGFTPQLVALSWVGFDQPRRIGRSETGARAALPIWLAIMRAASEALPVVDFTPPPDVLVRNIDPRSGLLAGPAWMAAGGEAKPEFFIAGTEPVEEVSEATRDAADVAFDLYGDGGLGGAGPLSASGSASGEPAPSEPAPSEPAPSEPVPSEPTPSEPAPSEPERSEPAPSEPAPSEPAADRAAAAPAAQPSDGADAEAPTLPSVLDDNR